MADENIKHFIPSVLFNTEQDYAGYYDDSKKSRARTNIGVESLSGSRLGDHYFMTHIATENGNLVPKAVIPGISDIANLTESLSGKKDTQNPVEGGASGTAAATSDFTFISNVTQDRQGVITREWKKVPDASTSAKGVVQLSDATNSSSHSLAATAYAVKQAYDEAHGAVHSVAASSTNGNVTVDGAEVQVYRHPSHTAYTGKPTANATPGFGDTVTISQIASDALGHVTGMTDRTITIPATKASSSKLGLIRLNYSPASGAKEYAVKVNSSGDAYVAVPWTDSDTKNTVGVGTKSGVSDTMSFYFPFTSSVSGSSQQSYTKTNANTGDALLEATYDAATSEWFLDFAGFRVPVFAQSVVGVNDAFVATDYEGRLTVKKGPIRYENAVTGLAPILQTDDYTMTIIQKTGISYDGSQVTLGPDKTPIGFLLPHITPDNVPIMDLDQGSRTYADEMDRVVAMVEYNGSRPPLLGVQWRNIPGQVHEVSVENFETYHHEIYDKITKMLNNGRMIYTSPTGVSSRCYLQDYFYDPNNGWGATFAGVSTMGNTARLGLVSCSSIRGTQKMEAREMTLYPIDISGTYGNERNTIYFL